MKFVYTFRITYSLFAVIVNVTMDTFTFVIGEKILNISDLIYLCRQHREKFSVKSWPSLSTW